MISLCLCKEIMHIDLTSVEADSYFITLSTPLYHYMKPLILRLRLQRQSADQCHQCRFRDFSDLSVVVHYPHFLHANTFHFGTIGVRIRTHTSKVAMIPLFGPLGFICLPGSNEDVSLITYSTTLYYYMKLLS
jgi:hypothetical protein